MSTISLSSVTAQPPSTTPNLPIKTAQTFWQKYISERRPEVQQLKDALASGDLAAAQQAYNNLVVLGNTVLHKDNPFVRSDRALDFNAIGGALQNGDLAGAQQAFAALESTFGYKTPAAASSSAPAPSTLANPDDAASTGAPSSGINIRA